MLRLFPICGSAHLPPRQNGTLLCEAVFSRAVNFRTETGKLLTIHRFGSGLSPMGLMLGNDDFEWLSARVKPNFHIGTDETGGWLGADNWQLSLRARKVLHLKIPTGTVSPTAVQQLAHWLSNRQSLSGFGFPIPETLRCLSERARTLPLMRLADALKSNDPDRISSVWADIMPKLLGAGHGLTPAGDDMLVGLLAGAHLLDLPAIHTIAGEIGSALQEDRTTSVSAAYLQHAAEGCFSTPFLKVVRALQSEYDSLRLNRRFSRFANYGHTSGLDTLVGLLLMLGSSHGFSKAPAS